MLDEDIASLLPGLPHLRAGRWAGVRPAFACNAKRRTSRSAVRTWRLLHGGPGGDRQDLGYASRTTVLGWRWRSSQPVADAPQVDDPRRRAGVGEFAAQPAGVTVECSR